MGVERGLLVFDSSSERVLLVWVESLQPLLEEDVENRASDLSAASPFQSQPSVLLSRLKSISRPA